MRRRAISIKINNILNVFPDTEFANLIDNNLISIGMVAQTRDQCSTLRHRSRVGRFNTSSLVRMPYDN